MRFTFTIQIISLLTIFHYGSVILTSSYFQIGNRSKMEFATMSFHLVLLGGIVGSNIINLNNTKMGSKAPENAAYHMSSHTRKNKTNTIVISELQTSNFTKQNFTVPKNGAIRATQKDGIDFGENEESQRVGGGKGCGSHFLLKAMSENITRKCVDLIGFRMENFPPKEEDLIKVNYEDKCFSKCYLTELHYMTESDHFDPNQIMEDMKRETPQDKFPARHNAIKHCLKHTEDMAEIEGGVANSPCKFALVFFVCARESEKRMIC